MNEGLCLRKCGVWDYYYYYYYYYYDDDDDDDDYDYCYYYYYWRTVHRVAWHLSTKSDDARAGSATRGLVRPMSQ